MHIVILAAAQRGIRCIKKISEKLTREDRLTVFTFNETPWEPPFSDSIETLCSDLGADFHKTSKVHHKQYEDIWCSEPDLAIVVGWRYLIPSSVYDAPRIGCFVFHDSMLPEYRGFGPTVWAMRNGESYTGATLFKMVEDMDAGPIVLQKKIAIEVNDYIADVVDKVTAAYENILDEAFPLLVSNSYQLVEQKHELATYTCKSLPSDFRIRWNYPAITIFNLIRGYATPYPGAFCFFNKVKLTILKANIDESQNYVGLFPGRIVKIVPDEGVYVAASDNLIFIEIVRLDDGEAVCASKVITKISSTLE